MFAQMHLYLHAGMHAAGVSFNQQNRYGGTSQELTESAGKRLDRT